MADGKLVVNTENLQGVTIPAMQASKTDLEDSYTRMKGIVNGLVVNGYMESETAQAYVDEFSTLLAPDIEKLTALIESYYTQLGQICDGFAAHDQGMARELC